MNRNIRIVLSAAAALAVMLISTVVFAQPDAAAAAADAAAKGPDVLALTKANQGGFIALGAGLAIGLAGLGCGIGQGLTAGNTTAGIARNPGAAGNMFTSFILGMVLIESIAIYGLVIAFMLQGKI